MSSQIVNVREIQDRASLHQVELVTDEFAPTGSFVVTSGVSGSKYQVTLDDCGGATCTCDWGKRRGSVDGSRSGCAHVQAVYLWLANATGTDLVACGSIEEAKGISPRVINIGDGVCYAVIGKERDAQR